MNHRGHGGVDRTGAAAGRVSSPGGRVVPADDNPAGNWGRLLLVDRSSETPLDWDVFTHEVLARNARISETLTSWWSGEGDLFQRVNECRGLVLAQMVEAEAVLHRIVELLVLGASPTEAASVVFDHIIRRRNASDLVSDVKRGLAAVGRLDADASERLATTRAAFDARNAHAHRPIRVHGAGSYQDDEGREVWFDGHVEFAGKPYGLQQLNAELLLAREATLAVLAIYDVVRHVVGAGATDAGHGAVSDA